MRNNIINTIWNVCSILIIIVLTIYIIRTTKKIETMLSKEVRYENPYKEENDSLKHEIDKLQIIKEYEKEKALAADDSTAYEMWQQLLSE